MVPATLWPMSNSISCCLMPLAPSTDAYVWRSACQRPPGPADACRLVRGLEEGRGRHALVPRQAVRAGRREHQALSRTAPAEEGREAGVQRQQPVALELARADLPVGPRAPAQPLKLAAQVEREGAPVEPFPVQPENLVAAQAVSHGGEWEA